MLNKVDGIANKTSTTFVNHIPDFIKFLSEANLLSKLNLNTEKKPITIEKHELNDTKIVTTGFRFDKQMIEKLNKFNIKIQDTINKQTSLLIVKDIDEESGKINTAKEKNIKIMTRDEFLSKYKF